MSTPIVTTTSTTALTADATNRAKRTFWQSLGVDVLVSVALYVAQLLAGKDSWSALDLKIISFMLFKTVALSAASFVMRRFLDDKIGVLLPPAPVPQPAEVVPTDQQEPEAYTNTVANDPTVEVAANQSPEPDVPESLHP